MYKFKKIDPDDIFKQIKALPKRLEAMKTVVGNMVAEGMQQDVVNRLPNVGSGWLAVYRRSIDFYYDGKEWMVAGETAGGGIKNYDSDATLLTFTSSDPASTIMKQYGSWTLDMIPALNVDYNGTITIKSASKTYVALRRRTLATAMPKIRQQLRSAGFDVVPYGVPNLNGILTADLVAFSRQLEEGRGDYPFPTVPHWRPAAATMNSQIKTSIALAKTQFKAILSGEVPAPVRPMSAQMKATISKFARRKTP